MVSSDLPPLEDEWGVSENRAAGNWISAPQFDAAFDGALTRSMIDIYENFYDSLYRTSTAEVLAKRNWRPSWPKADTK